MILESFTVDHWLLIVSIALAGGIFVGGVLGYLVRDRGT